jgi:hypothetical protein
MVYRREHIINSIMLYDKNYIQLCLWTTRELKREWKGLYNDSYQT